MSPLRPVSLDSRSCAFPLCPDEAELGKAWCRHHKDGDQVWPWDEHAGQVPAPPPRRPRAASSAKRRTPTGVPANRLDDEQLRDLHRRYREDYLSAKQIAADVWQPAGYPSQAACAQALLAGWHRLNLPVRGPGRISRR